MGASITLAGESLIAQKQAAQQILSVSRFVFANVPGLDTSGPVDRAAAKPAASTIVYTAEIPANNAGYVNPNQVVYSLQVGSDIGDWDFNWIGLESTEGVLFAVAYVPLQQKRKNIPPLQVGNNITRNFLVVYDGAQALTGITIDAKTWQHDFTVRLAGIDERERLSNRDVYGRACFFGDGLQVVKVGSAYQLKPGVAYIEGIRVQRSTALAITLPALPATAWLDVVLQRELSDVVASWSVVFGTGLADYVDSAGAQHYRVQLGTVASATTINDLRVVEPIDGALVKYFAARNGDYELLRARATTKEDVKLGNIPNAISDDADTDSSAILATTKAVKAVAVAVLKAIADIVSGATSVGKAKQLETARTFSLSGDATGSASFNGTGNAAIAVTVAQAAKLKTARTIALNGDASGSVSFDGSGNVTLTVTNAQAAKLATARTITINGDGAGSVSFDGAGDATINLTNAQAEKLKTARTLSITGDATGSLSFDGSANASMALTVNQAVKLKTARTFSVTGDATGSLSFDGSANASMALTVNQAVKLKTARTLTFTGAATGSGSFDGSANLSIALTAAAGSEGAAGVAKVATQVQTDAGEDDTAFITPKKLRWGFASSLGATGFIAFPSWLGGLILQWGNVTYSGSNGTNGLNDVQLVSFPLTFPSALWCVLLGQRQDDGAIGGNYVAYYANPTLNSVQIGVDLNGTSGTRSVPVSYLLIGK